MKKLFVAAVCLLLFALPPELFGQTADKSVAQSQAIARAIVELVSSGGAALLKENAGDVDLPKPVAGWLNKHKRALVGSGPSPFKGRSDWGVATTNGNKLFLHVSGEYPKNGKLLIPRLHNSIKSAKLFGATKELKVQPNVADWEISIGERDKNALVSVVELELNEPATLGQKAPPVVQQTGDVLNLHARYAVAHGEKLRFEPQAHKNTIGYWVNEKDWAQWRFKTARSGKYEIELRYGCGKNQGGSEIEISVGDAKLPFKVEATGGFQAWRTVKIGTVELEAGTQYNVTAKALMKAKAAVMDIQQITLRSLSAK